MDMNALTVLHPVAEARGSPARRGDPPTALQSIQVSEAVVQAAFRSVASIHRVSASR
jgi:hypothetical protein